MGIPDALQVNDLKISGGPEITDNSTVQLLYRVALSEDDLIKNRCLESTYSPDMPITVIVCRESLLEGVYWGILGMHGGGSIRRIVVPPELGFGDRKFGDIPPNSSLFFDICAVSVKQQPID